MRQFANEYCSVLFRPSATAQLKKENNFAQFSPSATAGFLPSSTAEIAKSQKVKPDNEFWQSVTAQLKKERKPVGLTEEQLNIFFGISFTNDSQRNEVRQDNKKNSMVNQWTETRFLFPAFSNPQTFASMAVAKPILRHRIIGNYKADADGVTVENIIDELLKGLFAVLLVYWQPKMAFYRL